jgi:hypothetical protein
MDNTLSKRAFTDAQKREVIEDLLAVWKYCPELRLGQLIINVMRTSKWALFYIEDRNLVDQAFEFVQKCG